MFTKRVETEQFVLPLYETVLFPGTTTRILVRSELGALLQAHGVDDMHLVGLAVREGKQDEPLSSESLYSLGTLVQVEGVQAADRGYVVQVRGLRRVAVEAFLETGPQLRVQYTGAPLQEALSEADRATMLAFILSEIRETSNHFEGSDMFLKPLEGMTRLENVIGFVLPFLSAPLEEKQALLESPSEREQGLAFLNMLKRQRESLELQIEMNQKLSDEMNQVRRETMLRQQLRAIQEELGESKGSSRKGKDYRAMIEEADMPAEVLDVAMEQLTKLETMGPQNPEAGMVRNYLELLVALPWGPTQQSDIDLNAARAILERDHHGLTKVKERIIQHLAVMKLKKDKKGSILLLVGPPGTGKTSLGRSIAEALNREYVRLSLGGIRDEAEIRGHRRTYIGALPGRIIQGIKTAGTRNPVFVLDEVDKVMASYNGNPASALLEVLDPEQNDSFSDHYLEVPYDLSDVFFVATANSLETIPAPLRDRMEIITISSYTFAEKFAIGKEHLLPLVLEEHGLDSSQFQVDDEALRVVIENYTREAGVRGLKKQLSKLARIASEKIVSGSVELPFSISVEMLPELLGKKVIRLDEALSDNVPGVATGLAWTPVGGDILFIEAMFMPGKGELILTGQLGDVMKESARISLSLIRSRLAHLIKGFDFNTYDIHIHVPSGAIPKDGPSAGVTLLTAVASLLLHKRVDPKLAMTGEITLRGSVLPVGGIKEKVLAAHRAGIHSVLLSKENVDDLNDLPEDIRDTLCFVTVETIEDVLRHALGVDLPEADTWLEESPSADLPVTAAMGSQ